jgi:hypothetical protein
MNDLFGFSNYTDHDFFHVRYGRGAVVIAIKRKNDDAPQKELIYPDLQIAKIFNTRDQNINSISPYFDPIQSIEEKNGFVKVIIKFDRNHKNKPSYRPLRSVIERVLPANQVTFEVIK